MAAPRPASATPRRCEHDTGRAPGAPGADRGDRARAGGARLARLRACASRRAAELEALERGAPAALRRGDRARCAPRGGGALDADTVVSRGLLRRGAARRRRRGRRSSTRCSAARRRRGASRAPPARATTPSRRGRWASACSTTSRSPRGTRSTRTALERVLILDWDVHHGNGTNDIFHADPRRAVRARSTSRRCIPGTGPARDVGRGRGARATRSTCRCRPARATTTFARWSSTSSCPLARAYAPAADAGLGRLRRARATTRSRAAGSPTTASRRWPRRCAALADELGVPRRRGARGRLRPRGAGAVGRRATLEVRRRGRGRARRPPAALQPGGSARPLACGSPAGRRLTPALASPLRGPVGRSGRSCRRSAPAGAASSPAHRGAGRPAAAGRSRRSRRAPCPVRPSGRSAPGRAGRQRRAGLRRDRARGVAGRRVVRRRGRCTPRPAPSAMTASGRRRRRRRHVGGADAARSAAQATVLARRPVAAARRDARRARGAPARGRRRLGVGRGRRGWPASSARRHDLGALLGRRGRRGRARAAARARARSGRRLGRGCVGAGAASTGCGRVRRRRRAAPAAAPAGARPGSRPRRRRRWRAARDRRAAGRAEAGVAAVQRAAARAGRDAGLAQLGDRPASSSASLERAQLAVDGVQRVDLRRRGRVVRRREAVLVEDEAAEVAEAELADAAQVAQAAAQAAAVAEARASGTGSGPGGTSVAPARGSTAARGVSAVCVGWQPVAAAPQARRWAAPAVGASARPAWCRPRRPDASDGAGGGWRAAGPSCGSGTRARRLRTGNRSTSRQASSHASRHPPRRPRAARSRPAMRGSAACEVRAASAGPPGARVERGAQRARDPVERRRVDADRRREHGDVAGERLEHGEPEALVRRRGRARRWRR